MNGLRVLYLSASSASPVQLENPTDAPSLKKWSKHKQDKTNAIPSLDITWSQLSPFLCSLKQGASRKSSPHVLSPLPHLFVLQNTPISSWRHQSTRTAKALMTSTLIDLVDTFQSFSSASGRIWLLCLQALPSLCFWHLNFGYSFLPPPPLLFLLSPSQRWLL